MNHIKIGEFIRYERENLGYSREYLAELANLSTATIWNVEAGRDNTTVETYNKIATALKFPLSIILPEIADHASSSELREVLNINEVFTNNPKEIDAYIQMQLLFYPKVTIADGYPIQNLLQALMYYPLIDRHQFHIILCDRISGEFWRYEFYCLNQLRHLYNQIEDSPAKRYADYESSKLNYCGLCRFFEDTDEQRQYMNSKDYEEGRKMYNECLAQLKNMVV